MNIRVWFGVDVAYNPSFSFNKSLDGLLALYAEAITQYFQAVGVHNAYELISFAKVSVLDIGQQMFLEWFESDGLPTIRETISSTGHADEKIIAEIDYTKYILSEEMSFDYPEEVRSILINVASTLMTKIKKMAEYDYSFELDLVGVPVLSSDSFKNLKWNFGFEPLPIIYSNVSYNGVITEAAETQPLYFSI